MDPFSADVKVLRTVQAAQCGEIVADSEGHLGQLLEAFGHDGLHASIELLPAISGSRVHVRLADPDGGVHTARKSIWALSIGPALIFSAVLDIL
jgi:hypothetical protein